MVAVVVDRTVSQVHILVLAVLAVLQEPVPFLQHKAPPTQYELEQVVHYKQMVQRRILH
jgi:hypothetical protein